jgi:chemotaxis protein MotB
VRPDLRRALGPDVAAPDDDQTGWLLTFSDLVLQLFAFVLVSVVLASAAPPPSPPPAPAEELAASPPHDATNERLAAAGRSLRQFVATEGRGDAVEVTVRDRDLVVTLNDTITFLSGSADLLPEGAPILRRIGALARAMPDFDLEVDGHTDDVPIHTGSFPSNLELSLARAARVAHELTVEAPELNDRTIAAGYGELRPAASNADETGRARNRRVEVRFLPRPTAG